MAVAGGSCPVCGGATAHHATGLAIARHEAHLLVCQSCGLVLVHEPAWLPEAYDMPIREEDSGLLHRCADMGRRTRLIISGEGLRGGRFLDWGGGYGVFTRMMRDRGLAFHHDDAYCENLFARGLEDEPESRYDLITAFEVMEHLTDPVVDLAETVARTDYFLFSTSLRPDPVPLLGEWEYYGLEHGQHVMFHTEQSLRVLGEKLGFQLTTNGLNLHLFHRAPLRARTRAMFSPLGRSVRMNVRRAVAWPRSMVRA